MENTHKEFGLAVNRLLEKEDFSQEEMSRLFRRLLSDEETQMHQGAFLAALRAKGETIDEIAAVWQAIYEVDTVKVKVNIDEPLVENSGTGMDRVKTFNISTAAALAAADEVYLARHGSRAITSSCGTIDILEGLGLDVEAEPNRVKESIEKAGIGIFNGMSAKVHPQALGRILSQISFGTVLNIAASLANPALPEYGVRGVYSPDLVAPVAGLMREIGYKRALVVHGLQHDGAPGMDEAGTIGETVYAELKENGSVEMGSFYPEDFHMKRAKAEELAPMGNREAELLRFVALIGGKAEGPALDIACLNAGLILYVGGKAGGFLQGYEKAHTLFAEKRALSKLRQWIAVQNRDADAGMDCLEKLVAKA